MSTFPRESDSHPAPPASKTIKKKSNPRASLSPSELRNPVLSACPALFPLEFLKL